MKRFPRRIIAAVLAVSLAVALAACGTSGPAKQQAGSYQDGTYTGRSPDHQDDESGHGSGYGQVELTIQGGKVTACTFTLYELDGTVKGEDYGADLSKENRLKAQKAVQSAEKYASMLVETGSPGGVDAISGATISHEEFLEAVDDALSQAAQP